MRVPNQMPNLRKDWTPTTCYFKTKHVFKILKNGKKEIIFDKQELALLTESQKKNTMELPCNKCIYCQVQYSNQWAVRCVLEARATPYNNSFITLTYNDENVPKDGFLNKRDVQLFIKKVRKSLPGVKIRYFLAGEYGRQNYRPHFHIVFFNFRPKDIYNSWNEGNTTLWRSRQIEKMWGKGFISVGLDIEMRTMKYIAKYLTKCSPLPERFKNNPEYVQPSNHPGIAANQYTKDIWETGCIYIQGFKYGIPKYYEELAVQQGHTKELEEYKVKQRKRAKENEITKLEKDRRRYDYFQLKIVKEIGHNHLYDMRYLGKVDEIEYTEETLKKMSQSPSIMNRNY